jgi:hypothetical protein
MSSVGVCTTVSAPAVVTQNRRLKRQPTLQKCKDCKRKKDDKQSPFARSDETLLHRYGSIVRLLLEERKDRSKKVPLFNGDDLSPILKIS